MSPKRLDDLRVDRVAMVDQGADQDAEIVLWKRLGSEPQRHGDESAADALDRLAKAMHDRAPWGTTRDQAFAAMLETPEGRELYAQHASERRMQTND